MNAKTVAGHAAVATIFSVVWEVAIAMPAGPTSTALAIAGVGPYLFAGVSLGLLSAGQGSKEPTRPPLPAQRRAVRTVRRKELTR